MLGSRTARKVSSLYQFKKVIFSSRWDEFPKVCCFGLESKDGRQKNWNSKKIAKTKVILQYTGIHRL